MGKLGFSICAVAAAGMFMSMPAYSSEGEHHHKEPSQTPSPAGQHSPQSHAKTKSGPQKAHEHGYAIVQVAVQNLDIAVRVEGPAEAFFGFEKKPKSEKEKEIVHDIEKKLKTDLLRILGVDSGLGCHFDQLDITHGLEEYPQTPSSSPGQPSAPQKKGHEDHADLELDAKGKCTKSPVGSTLKFAFIKEFTRIKKLKLEVLSGEKVQSQLVTKATTEVQL